MDLPGFLDTLDRFGAVMANWPANLQGAAESLLARSPAARQALATMEEIEHLLRATSSRLPRGGASHGIDALAAVAMRHRQGRPVFLAVRPATRAVFVAGAAFMLGLGLVIGWGTNDSDEGPDHALAIAFDSAGSLDVD